jgi:hypothetical protein
MSDIEPSVARTFLAGTPRRDGYLTRKRADRLTKALQAVENDTLLRVAAVQGEGFVAGEKLHESGRLGVIFITELAHLRGIANVVSADDPILHDDARFAIDLIKLGSGEILADTIRRLERL